VVYSEQGTTLSVLTNDIDVDDEPLTIVSISYSGTGTAALENNEIHYIASSDFKGNETLEYVVADAAGLQSTATVTIKVINTALNIEETKNSVSSSGGSMAGLLIGLFGLVFRRSAQKVM
jgi:hypothetical protein